MCGRYAAGASPEDLVEEFEVEADRSAEPARSILVNPQEPPAGTPDFNMAPSKQAPVVLTRALRRGDEGSADGRGPVRQLRLLTWGLVPGWAKDARGGVRLVNARADTLLTTAAFARAARARRCLVPATGWYEWQASPTVRDAKGRPRKQPFFVHRTDGSPCAFAGLYEFWRDPGVEDPADPMAWLTTFAIVTTVAEPGLDRIHDRQPLVLDRDLWECWLSPDRTGPADVEELLRPGEPGRFSAYAVSRAVGSNHSNGPGLLDPAPVEELEGVVDPTTGEVIGGPRDEGTLVGPVAGE